MKSSSVIAVTRGTGAQLEVFWSQRQHSMQFLGGFWAFAGGSVEASDRDVPVVGELPARFEQRMEAAPQVVPGAVVDDDDRRRHASGRRGQRVPVVSAP